MRKKSLTFEQFFTKGLSILKARGVPNAFWATQSVFAKLCNCSKAELLKRWDQHVEESFVNRFSQFLERIDADEPVEFFLGEVDFYGCRFFIEKGVCLLPRPETELMTADICRQLKTNWEKKRILDLCCGSGVIGISLKKQCREVQVDLADICLECVTLAKKNAKRNKVEVAVYQSDLFEKLEGRYDLIVCNPPYISEERYEKLETSVKKYDPKKALVAKEDGFWFYKQLALSLDSILSLHAHCVVEIGEGQKERVIQLFQVNNWKMEEVKKDYAGIDRWIIFEKGEKEKKTCLVD